MNDTRIPLHAHIIKTIKAKTALTGVIGLGYVGLPLAIEFCNAGFDVIGFDIDEEKVNLLKEGKSYISYIPDDLIKKVQSKFHPTTDFAKLKETDVILICVPTPLNRHREPDMTYVFSTAETISRYLRKGQLVVLESTTYPGTTDEDLKNILEKSGLKAGEDFFLAYSPEREDPNNKEFLRRKIPKIVGGYSTGCLEVAKALYEEVFEKIVPVSSTKVAEAAKLLENIYRAVNIALVNELKVLFDRMGINIWEVIEAAKTKPFGFQAFYPGPGLGGHCIPIDPFYLTWKGREYDFHTKFIELAGEINTSMPYYVVEKTIEFLNQHGICIKGAKILILGVAYKKDVNDTRESPALVLMELLQEKGAIVDYNDPYVPRLPKMRKHRIDKQSVELTPETLSSYHCIIIVTDHSTYDPEFILKHARLIVDTRNMIKDSTKYKHKVIKA